MVGGQLTSSFARTVVCATGFQIKEDLLQYHCSLYVAPGARVKSQMTTSECKQTKEVANLRFHVERAICRMKTFQLLKDTLPLTMLSYADVLHYATCAALDIRGHVLHYATSNAHLLKVRDTLKENCITTFIYLHKSYQFF